MGLPKSEPLIAKRTCAELQDAYTVTQRNEEGFVQDDEYLSDDPTGCVSGDHMYISRGCGLHSDKLYAYFFILYFPDIGEPFLITSRDFHGGIAGR